MCRTEIRAYFGGASREFQLRFGRAAVAFEGDFEPHQGNVLPRVRPPILATPTAVLDNRIHESAKEAVPITHQSQRQHAAQIHIEQ